MSSRSVLTQSETTVCADISVDVELATYDSGYNSSESPCFISGDDHNNAAILHESLLFHNKGYRKLYKLSDTLQGDLYKCETIGDHKKSYVAIKRTNKELFEKRISIEDGTHFCVCENIVKEALILKTITVDNAPIGGYIAKYIDFFQSSSDYYLVTEYIESETNLKQFVERAREWIANGKLSMAKYRKMLKYLLWQLFVTIEWLHQCMHCCHLDLCMDNIMVVNCNLMETKDGAQINPNIAIKLVDFGVSEIFKSKTETDSVSFLCEKHYLGYLSLENEGYFSPQIFNGGRFNAILSDNWCLGMILFECLTFCKLYSPITMNEANSGYQYLCRNKLGSYLVANHMLNDFSADSLSLVSGLLSVKESKRLCGINILTHSWFKMYFKRYKPKLIKKFTQKRKISVTFPFYH